jgi:hypothetical protein
MRHDQYRYDDIERFSTNLNEQKIKTRQIVQAFIQIVDFIKTGKKKNINEFRNHASLTRFDDLFRHYYMRQRLYNIGFQKNDMEYLLKSQLPAVLEFEKHFRYFESIKTARKTEKVADGINRPAIFNMRDLSRELPKLLVESHGIPVDCKRLFEIMLSNNASSRDGKLTEKYQARLNELQISYIELVNKVRRRRSLPRALKDIELRSKVINRADRATGNAIIMVVEKIIANIKSGFSTNNIQELIEGYVESQLLVPQTSAKKHTEVLKRKKPETQKLLNKLFVITNDLKDEI